MLKNNRIRYYWLNYLLLTNWCKWEILTFFICFKKIAEKWQAIVYENHFLSNRYRVATFSSSSSIEDYRGTWWWTQRSIRTRNCSPIKVFPFCTSLFSSLFLLLLTPIFSNTFHRLSLCFPASSILSLSLFLYLSIAGNVPRLFFPISHLFGEFDC